MGAFIYKGGKLKFLNEKIIPGNYILRSRSKNFPTIIMKDPVPCTTYRVSQKKRPFVFDRPQRVPEVDYRQK